MREKFAHFRGSEDFHRHDFFPRLSDAREKIGLARKLAAFLRESEESADTPGRVVEPARREPEAVEKRAKMIGDDGIDVAMKRLRQRAKTDTEVREVGRAHTFSALAAIISATAPATGFGRMPRPWWRT